MTGKQMLPHSVLSRLVMVALILVAGLMSQVAAAAGSSTSANQAAFHAFTSAPDKASKQTLQQYFSEQEVHPMIDWTPEFEEMIENGHPLALGVAFESLPYMGGATTLHLSRLIGKTILSAPEAFLQTATQRRSSIRRLDMLVWPLGDEYVDNVPATIRGLEDHYFSLRNVDSQDYSEARNEILLFLSEQIFKLRKSMASDDLTW